ncbi:AAA family ATPase [Paenibacillus turpanensis]|uniref:AAA family ATPase n=1 Tax=Paenibacillus turpanensis TaxID=2689078 RepID=UPI001408E4D5|nr:AAA family ATPase [Paenibacillus turpanensis]
MIIWINGAFGAGKTQTAYELHRRLSGSFVYDPENAGYFIRSNLPRSIVKKDFQDFPMWRECNYSMLSAIATQFEGTCIVPMTIVNKQYFDEIVGRLRNDGVNICHFSLLATKEVLLKRLRSRWEGPQSWAAKQIDRCLDGLSDPCFAFHLDTSHLTIDEVVAQIAEMAGVELQPDSRGALKKKADRVFTQLKQLRI